MNLPFYEGKGNVLYSMVLFNLHDQRYQVLYNKSKCLCKTPFTVIAFLPFIQSNINIFYYFTFIDEIANILSLLQMRHLV